MLHTFRCALVPLRSGPTETLVSFLIAADSNEVVASGVVDTILERICCQLPGQVVQNSRTILDILVHEKDDITRDLTTTLFGYYADGLKIACILECTTSKIGDLENLRDKLKANLRKGLATLVAREVDNVLLSNPRRLAVMVWIGECADGCGGPDAHCVVVLQAAPSCGRQSS